MVERGREGEEGERRRRGGEGGREGGRERRGRERGREGEEREQGEGVVKSESGWRGGSYYYMLSEAHIHVHVRVVHLDRKVYITHSLYMYVQCIYS